VLYPIEPPAPVVDLEEAKRHLGVDDNDADDLIEALVAAATGKFDGPNGIGRALGQQTWELRIDRPWPGCRHREIRLPLPPLQSVESVTYLDEDGAEQTLATSDYDVVGVGGMGRVVLKASASWPAMYDGAEVLRVRFVAGYDEVPAPLRQAILLQLGDLYEKSGEESSLRSETVDGVGSRTYATGENTGLNAAAEALVKNFRVMFA
jgi:uncharacterized phiE125 gp8 family phage protein